MTEPLAYLNGDFIPVSKLSISVDDLGVIQGVAVSERLRTFGGVVFRLDEHLQRLDNSLQIVDLTPELSIPEIGDIVQELVRQNLDCVGEGDDLGISLFVTPGLITGGSPTVGIHAHPLPFGQWAAYFTEGQMLADTGVRQVPSSCWPIALKCRSRMHYYLADQLANRRFPGSCGFARPGWVCIGSIDGEYCDPPGWCRDSVSTVGADSSGVSLSVLAELADALGISFHYRDMRVEDLRSADEILLCSTTPCVWSVTKLNGQAVGRGADGPVFQQLLKAWSELVGLDIAAQARQFSHRME